MSQAKQTGAALAALCALLAPAAEFGYRLESQGNVTLVIEDAAGRRVRNLVSDAPRLAGPVTETWDGRDDYGYPVDPGDYRWRGLVHGPIESRYVGSFCSPHSEEATPWKSLDAQGLRTHEGGTGGWLSDHCAPSVALAVEDEMLLGCAVAEEGDALIRVTLDGRKVWGSRWQALVGTTALAHDPSDGALYVAGERGWVGNRIVIVRRRLKDGAVSSYPVPKDVRDRLSRQDPAFSDKQLIRLSTKDYSGLVGMGITGGKLALALADRGRLALFDVRTALFVGEIPLAKPAALCGEYAISDGQIVRIDFAAGTTSPVTRDAPLVCPRGLARDASGRFYVSDAAPGEMCVKVFSPDGRLVGRIARRGGRREGAYDPEAMDSPAGLAVDAKGLVWVTERSESPRRVSVWTQEGRLVREFVGGAHYGGGGSVVGDRGYYNGQRYRLSRAPRQGELEAVLFRPDAHPGFPFDLRKGLSLHQAVAFGGRRYLLADDGWARAFTLVAEEVGDRAVLRAAWGGARALTNGVGNAKGAFIWRDANGDGAFQPEELRLLPDWRYGTQWALRSSPTLDAFFADVDERRLLRVVRVRAQPDGGAPAPRWALDAPVLYPVGRTPHDEIIGSSPNGQSDDILVNLRGPHGGDLTNSVYLCVSPGGEVRWSYPNPYPTNGFTSPVPRRGEIRHTLNAEGFAEVAGLGTIWQLNGNFGTRYLFTSDGLFVTELFGDQRVRPAMNQVMEAPFGCVLSGHSLIGECFHGWLGNGLGGRVLQVVGKQTCNVCEVTGLQTARRLSGGVVTLRTRARPLAALPRRAAHVVRAIEMEGNWMPSGEKWHLIAPHAIGDEERLAVFSVGSARGTSLALQIRVEDPTPFVNRGTDYATLFRSGDAVDIRLAGDPTADPKRTAPVAGDVRYVIAPDAQDAKGVRIVRYTYVDGTATCEPTVFRSPVGSCSVARVEMLAGCGTRIVRDKTGYTLSVAIPHRHLPLSPHARLEGRFLMDVGVIFGDAAGGEAQRREYFFDAESRIVHDIPSEAMVWPCRWGTLEAGGAADAPLSR